MSQAPFSKPDVNEVVNSSPVFKKHLSLIHWSGVSLPNAWSKRHIGLVVITLLVLGLQLTACGNTAPTPISSASPTSNSTSQPNTPSATNGSGSNSASTPTTGATTTPTTGQTSTPTVGATITPTIGATTTPTTGSTATPTAVPTATPTTGVTSTPTPVPTPDPSSFTVTEAGVSFSGIAGISDPASHQIQVNYTAAGSLTWKVTASTDDGANWLTVNPSSDTMSETNKQEPITITASNLKANLSPGSYTGTLSFTPVNPNHDNTVSVSLLVGPGVLSLNPTNGAAGTSVVISGYGFTKASGVTFGSVAASSFTVDSDNQITAVSPAGSGTVDVKVTNPGFTSLITAGDKFTYNSPPAPPTISGINPASGSAAGGTIVTINGTGFTGATGVSFGSTATSAFKIDSDTQITVTSPASTSTGTVSLTVTTPNGSASAQFTYT